MRHTQTAGGMGRRFGLMAAIARFLSSVTATGGAGTDATSAIDTRPLSMERLGSYLSGPYGVPPIPRRVPNQRQRRKMIASNPRLAAKYRKGGRR